MRQLNTSLPEDRPDPAVTPGREPSLSHLRDQAIQAAVLLADTIDKQHPRAQVRIYTGLLKELRRLGGSKVAR